MHKPIKGLTLYNMDIVKHIGLISLIYVDKVYSTTKGWTASVVFVSGGI